MALLVCFSDVGEAAFELGTCLSQLLLPGPLTAFDLVMLHSQYFDFFLQCLRLVFGDSQRMRDLITSLTPVLSELAKHIDFGGQLDQQIFKGSFVDGYLRLTRLWSAVGHFLNFLDGTHNLGFCGMEFRLERLD